MRRRLPVGVRLSADEHASGGLTLDDTLEIVDALQEAAPADYISITTGMRGAYVKDSTFDEGFARGLSQAVKEVLDVPVVVAGRFRLPDLAEGLAAEQADFIAFGRAMLADAGVGDEVRTGRVAEIRPCIRFVQDCRRAEGLVACAVNARTGRELDWGGRRAPRLSAGSSSPARDRPGSKRRAWRRRRATTWSSTSAPTSSAASSDRGGRADPRGCSTSSSTPSAS